MAEGTFKNAAEAKQMQEALMAEMNEMDQEIKKHEMGLGPGEDTMEEEEDGGEDEMADKLAGWEKRKEKYKKYIDKGKFEKLEKVKAKQEAKLEKAKEKGKSESYIAYKAAKIDWTAKACKAALLVHNMKKSGLC
ncbi:hypothetical protein AB1Y20_010869 [Prymnesium parvum]|uniref:Clathrin light chain n=1 Tax=Prymnesium parvum TaxID=97485 RepID=A0AB34ISI7_PRYPA|eukprot:CAMPEP_0184381216 /NCGR_PEP_ID=MMETSP0007-20130409/5351_1 /TAXON_ID=97485 /ORGANISM="Prymnesium parvum, Strain Texoma1" /LENGTH=134 /DNA_ID=CAMNT_0026726753 /DNA_START=54 /DNA_END=458 /DNA_ORIENTATION=+